MACLALTATLLVAGRWQWLPLLFVVWTQLHGAVVLGLVAIVGAILAEVWQRRRPPTSLLFVLVACGAASLASPLRLDLWLFVFEWMERSRVNQIVDWLPPGFGPNLWVFWGVAAALPVLAFRARRSLSDRDARLVAIALILLPVALRAVRNVPMFLLIAVPAVVVAAAAGRHVPQPRAVHDNLRLNAGLLAVTIAIGASVVGVLWSLPIPRLGWTPVSPSAAQAIRACPEPMYNTFEPGGALLWFVPERRVFIDNRQDPYPADLLQASRTVEVSGEYEALFAEFGIRCAVVPPDMPTAARLAADPGWTSTFVDRELQVFVQATDSTSTN